MSYLAVKQISRKLGSQQILRKIDLSLERHQIMCLLGPSGSGKTTLLRIIAGLEPSEHGHVYLDGRCLDPVPPHRRQVGLMFQDLALFPHKPVFDNVAFGLRMQPHSEREVREAVRQMLDLVGLTGFDKRPVDTLSGGERQRVALARSLAPKPHLLLLDEPLGALDRRLREKLTGDLRRILREVGVTAVMVTHDQAEAFRMADQVALMMAGEIVQTGAPERIYQFPNSLEIADFLGQTNQLPGNVVGRNRVRTAMGEITVSVPERLLNASGVLVLHPDSAHVVSLDMQKWSPGQLKLSVEIEEILYQGPILKIVAACKDGQRLTFDLLRSNRDLSVGRRVMLRIDGRHAAFIPDSQHNMQTIHGRTS